MKGLRGKKSTKGREPRNHMRGRTNMAIISGNAELNNHYLRKLVALGNQDITGKKARHIAVNSTKNFAKMNRIPWKL